MLLDNNPHISPVDGVGVEFILFNIIPEYSLAALLIFACEGGIKEDEEEGE
jgi:hypothetical protein